MDFEISQVPLWLAFGVMYATILYLGLKAFLKLRSKPPRVPPDESKNDTVEAYAMSENTDGGAAQETGIGNQTVRLVACACTISVTLAVIGFVMQNGPYPRMVGRDEPVFQEDNALSQDLAAASKQVRDAATETRMAVDRLTKALANFELPSEVTVQVEAAGLPPGTENRSLRVNVLPLIVVLSVAIILIGGMFIAYQVVKSRDTERPRGLRRLATNPFVLVTAVSGTLFGSFSVFSFFFDISIEGTLFERTVNEIAPAAPPILDEDRAEVFLETLAATLMAIEETTSTLSTGFPVVVENWPTTAVGGAQSLDMRITLNDGTPLSSLSCPWRDDAAGASPPDNHATFRFQEDRFDGFAANDDGVEKLKDFLDSQTRLGPITALIFVGSHDIDFINSAIERDIDSNAELAQRRALFVQNLAHEYLQSKDGGAVPPISIAAYAGPIHGQESKQMDRHVIVCALR